MRVSFFMIASLCFRGDSIISFLMSYVGGGSLVNCNSLLRLTCSGRFTFKASYRGLCLLACDRFLSLSSLEVIVVLGFSLPLSKSAMLKFRTIYQ